MDKPLVLVADDNEGTCTLIRAVLHGSFEVDVVGDGLEAVERLRTRQYAAILLDLLMPVADGFTVLDHLREHRPDMLARVLVMTAAVSPQHAQRVQAYAVRALITKPFDVDALLAAVHGCASSESASFRGGPYLAGQMILLLAAEVLLRRG